MTEEQKSDPGTANEKADGGQRQDGDRRRNRRRPRSRHGGQRDKEGDIERSQVDEHKGGAEGQIQTNPRQGQPKHGQPRQSQPGQSQPKQGQPRQGQPRPEQPAQGQPRQSQPKQGQTRPEQPQQGLPTQNQQRPGQPRQSQPMQGQPRPDQPKEGQPKQELPRQSQTQQGQLKKGQPKQGIPKQGQPKQGQPQQGKTKPATKTSQVAMLNRRQTRGESILPKPEPEELQTQPSRIANNVDEYIKHLHGWQREVVSTLRSIVRSQSGDVSESILWSQPVYSLNGPVCYIKAFTDHVNFGFWRGNEIDDPDNLLSGELETMRHVTIRSMSDVKRDVFERMIKQAVRLNKEKGDATA